MTLAANSVTSWFRVLNVVLAVAINRLKTKAVKVPTTPIDSVTTPLVSSLK